MKSLYILLLALLSVSAQACDPSAGTRLSFGGTADGVLYATWWCPPAKPYFEDGADWAAVQPSALAPAKLNAWLAAYSAGDVAGLKALRDTETPAAIKAAYTAAILPKLVATTPPARAVVQKYGTYADRAAYVVIASTSLRSTKVYPDVRAPVGARAACAVTMITEGDTVYCAWTANGKTLSNLVTIVSLVK